MDDASEVVEDHHLEDTVHCRMAVDNIHLDILLGFLMVLRLVVYHPVPFHLQNLLRLL